MNQLGLVRWDYISQGPYCVERYDPATHDLIGDIIHHPGFVQAMEAFWADHASPGLRTVIDGRGVMIVGQVIANSPAWELPMSEEVARYLQATMDPSTFRAFAFIPQIARWIAETECDQT